MTESALPNRPRRRFSGFDYFIIAGGLVNLAVIGLLVGYWLFTL